MGLALSGANSCACSAASPASSTSRSVRMPRPFSRSASVGKLWREHAVHQHQPAHALDGVSFTAAAARVSAAASGAGASGSTSRISARRSVYFQSSIRRCGRPIALIGLEGLPPRSRRPCRRRAAGRARRRSCRSARVRSRFLPKLRSSQNPYSASGRVFELGVAGSLELQRQFLAAAFDDPALRHHVHEIRHDVVEQPLIVR